MTIHEKIQHSDMDQMVELLFELVPDCDICLWRVPGTHLTYCNGHCKENIRYWLAKEDKV